MAKITREKVEEIAQNPKHPGYLHARVVLADLDHSPAAQEPVVEEGLLNLFATYLEQLRRFEQFPA